MKKVIVIGGGISGLTTAFWLMKNGINVKLLEKNNYVGGSIKTEVINGFMIEHGPNSTLETTPLIDKLLGELGIKEEKLYATDEANKRFILRSGKLYPLPLNPFSFLFTGLFSPLAKLRLIKEPFINSKSTETETIAEFTKRRLGNEFLDYAINPFIAGVFAGDPQSINVKTAFPKLYELEQDYGSLIKGAIRSSHKRKKSEEKSKQSARTFSFKKGMQTLVDSIYDKLKNNIVTGVEMIDLRKAEQNKYDIEYHVNGQNIKDTSEAIVISTQAHETTNFVKNFDKTLADEIGNVYYPPVNVIFTGFKKSNVRYNLEGFGYLIPEKENKQILGTLWNSVIFPGRAPEGYYALTSFIGGSRNPQLTQKDDEENLNITLSELDSIMGINVKPEIVKIIRWNKAIPQYNNNYAELTEKVGKLMDYNKGLYICNNFYKGISVSDCIKNSDATVNSILSYFNSID
jgi:oxygen-dependent protoporphyrinogen oxidase